MSLLNSACGFCKGHGHAQRLEERRSDGWYWGPTTGKHLNAIDSDKSRRIPGDKFEALLAEAFG